MQQYASPGLGRLRDRVAVVTGADNGIGRATALLFACEGARVVCFDIRESGERRVDRAIAQAGGEAVFVQGDVASAAVCERIDHRSVLRRDGATRFPVPGLESGRRAVSPWKVT